MSVALICHNHERYVEAALDSIAAQTLGALELVVIDDASTDATAERVRAWQGAAGFPLRLIVHERNVGLCAGLNEAIAEAAAPYFCSLSGDDLMAPDRLRLQVQRLEASTLDVAVAYSDAALIDEHGNPTGRTYLSARTPVEGQVRAELIEGNFIPAPSALIRRTCLEAVGPYNTALAYEDYEMWLRLSRQFEFAFVPGELVSHRKHAAALSKALGFRFEELVIEVLLAELRAVPADGPALSRRIAQVARELYAEGDHSAVVGEGLRHAARQRGSYVDRSYLWSFRAHIPGTWIKVVRRRARSRPFRVPEPGSGPG